MKNTYSPFLFKDKFVNIAIPVNSAIMDKMANKKEQHEFSVFFENELPPSCKARQKVRKVSHYELRNH